MFPKGSAAVTRSPWISNELVCVLPSGSHAVNTSFGGAAYTASDPAATFQELKWISTRAQFSPKQVLLVYALHLKSNRGEVHEDIRIREESMQQLRAHMKAMNGAYGKIGALTWIVGGDFNTAPDEPRFAGEKTVPGLLADGFSWVWQGIPLSARITMPADARYPAAAFDQIFYRGASLGKAWVASTSVQSSV